MTISLRATHDQFAAKEFLVVQFLDRSFRFFDRLHLNEGESLRALVMLVGHYFRVLHLTHTVEQIEEIALGCFEGEVAHVKTRGRYFDVLGLARGAHRTYGRSAVTGRRRTIPRGSG